METKRKISLNTVILEGIKIGMENALSLIGASILYIITIWIPYINVGTTIAMASIPIILSKGEKISATFIFDAKYRKYLGEFFTLMGLMYIAIIPALFFLVVPGFIIAIGWSLALYILLDKNLTPGEALVYSNKATYGYKWTIFGVRFLLVLAAVLLSGLLSLFGIIGSILSSLVMIFLAISIIGCNTVIYKKLVLTDYTEEETIITDIKTDSEETITVEVNQTVEDENKEE